LPGAEKISDQENFKFFAGYVELNPGILYYYWFFESQRNPEADPVVLSLNGGPACSGEVQALE
jgi:carboxypeptidase C (cathepsin A)